MVNENKNIKIMKRTIRTVILAAIAAILTTSAAQAQVKWAKSAAKTTFTLKTFAPNGNLIGSGSGFFIGANGEAVSNYAPFKGASRAVVIDAGGSEHEVECIIGANDMYDVAKFKVNATKTQFSATTATPAQEGSILWMMPYAAKKVPVAVMGTATKVEKPTDKDTYITMQMQVPETAGGCPLYNENGEVVGIMQQPVQGDNSGYATSLSMAANLVASPFIMNDPALSATMIKKALPDDVKDATVTLYTAHTMADSTARATLVDDFIAKFPDAPEGYRHRAQALIDAGRYADADKDMQKAISVAKEKDDIYYTLAKIIYTHNVYVSPEQRYAPWTLEKAEEAINNACSLKPMPLYASQKAEIKFVQKQYAEAYDIYMQLVKDGNPTAENYYGAARCKEQLGDSTAFIALLDSAVATFSEPYVRDAAPYFLARAEARMAQNKMRDAVLDLNIYEKLIPQVNDRFYYIRFEAEKSCRLYQQALNDISQAISKDDKNPLYYAEKAALQINVKMVDEAIATAQELIALDPKSSDGYLFLGLGQCIKGNKAEGRKNLEKAKEMGDTQAEALIEKYGK